MRGERMTTVPIPLTLLVCDGAHRDPSTGKWTLLGLFNSIQSGQFPSVHTQMVAYLALTDANGKIPIRLQIIDEESEEPVFRVDAELTIHDPRAVAEIVMPICDVEFQRPGDYRLQAFAANEFLMERRITLVGG